jgi:hypothetical protein
MSTDLRMFNIADNEARMGNHAEIIFSKFHIISISDENLKMCIRIAIFLRDSL